MISPVGCHKRAHLILRRRWCKMNPRLRLGSREVHCEYDTKRFDKGFHDCLVRSLK
jgi:hypothetical protein